MSKEILKNIIEEFQKEKFIEDFHKNIQSTIGKAYKRLIKDLEKSKKLPIKV